VLTQFLNVAAQRQEFAYAATRLNGKNQSNAGFAKRIAGRKK
jgi:hypothetical protein